MLLFLLIPFFLAIYSAIKYRSLDTKLSGLDYRSLSGKPIRVILNLFQLFVHFLITGPILEESFFRCTLYNWTSTYQYYREFNSLLFGIIHASNYFVIEMHVEQSILQCISSTLLGYFLINLDNIGLAMITHISYNIFCLLLVILIDIFSHSEKNKNKERNDINTSPITTIFNKRYINHPMLRRCRSDPDLLKIFGSRSKVTIVNVNNIPKNIRDKFIKFDEIMKINSKSIKIFSSK